MLNLVIGIDKLLKIVTKNNTRRRGSGPRRGSARSQVLGKGPASPIARARSANSSPAPNATSGQSARKIIVSNLPVDVNEAQIKVSALHYFINHAVADLLKGTFLLDCRFLEGGYSHLRQHRQVKGHCLRYLQQPCPRREGIRAIQQQAH